MPQTGVDFPLQCTSNVDVQCGAGSPGSLRLHRPFFMQPYVSNTGCDAVGGQLTLIKDSRVVYDATLSTIPADTVRGDTLIWNYGPLTSLAGGAYWNCFLSDLYMSLDSTVVAGDTMCFRVYTGIPAADVNPLNNDYSFCLPVVYSFDPNEKEVSPKGRGAEGFIPAGTDTLTYTVHFQNTGSDVAENIIVIDTLDSHINPASFKILGTSHLMTPQWLAPGIVQFNYNYIELPDSFSNEAASHGWVRFSVALNDGLPAATQIKNTGYIYFDLNPPVVTNTTLNTIESTTSVAQSVAHKPAKVYPNPAAGSITVEGLNGGKLSVLSMNGTVALEQNITSDKTTLDISGLPAGVYILKTVDKYSTATTKFTKY